MRFKSGSVSVTTRRPRYERRDAGQALISVFTPTRNRREWIRRCQRSILAQDGFEDWEHVVYDVGDPGETVADLLDLDHRVRYFRGECQGVAADFQAALALTTGEVVTPLADDDRLPSHALRIAHDLLADSDASWLNGRTVAHDRAGEPLYLRGGTMDHIEDTREGNYMLGGAVYWRRELTDEVGGFSSEFDGAADVDLYRRFLAHSDPVVSRDVLYLYTDWNGTDSRVNAARQADATRRAVERSRR